MVDLHLMQHDVLHKETIHKALQKCLTRSYITENNIQHVNGSPHWCSVIISSLVHAFLIQDWWQYIVFYRNAERILR